MKRKYFLLSLTLGYMHFSLLKYKCFLFKYDIKMSTLFESSQQYC